MEIVIKRFGMKRVLFLFLCWSLVGANELSFREYKSIDEQLAYNAIKKIFVLDDRETIVDTNWSTLHISNRSTTGFINIDASVESLVIRTEYDKESDSKKMSVEIFTTVDDENSSVSSNSFLHTLVWNRIEYALGLDDNWVKCVYSPYGLFHLSHPLCTVDKETLRLEK